MLSIQPGLVPPPPPPPPVLGNGAIQGQGQAGPTSPAQANAIAAATASMSLQRSTGLEGAGQTAKEPAEASDAEGVAAAAAALDGSAGAAFVTAPFASATGGAAKAEAPTTTQAASAQASSAPAVPLGAVPMTIGLRSLAGSNHFEIRLDPKELGRIDVNLDIDKEQGTVKAHLVVDRPETLALLQRDAGSLQQALSQAGLDAAADGSINLSLRSDTQSNGQGSEGRRSESQNRGGGSGFSDPADPRLSPDTAPLLTLRGLGGIDIRI
ncbi:flagellar hook-length control protein FliK [Methylobacterium sp. BTF04]|nr:flagellar hook-length control protein FliK [Methylobacterium sp. BTF04]